MNKVYACRNALLNNLANRFAEVCQHAALQGLSLHGAGVVLHRQTDHEVQAFLEVLDDLRALAADDALVVLAFAPLAALTVARPSEVLDFIFYYCQI